MHQIHQSAALQIRLRGFPTVLTKSSSSSYHNTRCFTLLPAPLRYGMIRRRNNKSIYICVYIYTQAQGFWCPECRNHGSSMGATSTRGRSGSAWIAAPLRRCRKVVLLEDFGCQRCPKCVFWEVILVPFLEKWETVKTVLPPAWEPS